MKLRTFVGMSLCVSATALAGCGSEPGEAPASPSLEEALANLPGDFEARAAALDSLYERFMDDPRLTAALRKFEADNTPGLLRRVERDDGRFVSFVALEGGGVVIEGGPRSLQPLTLELGLTEADPVQLWRALLPGEPVPSSLVGTWDESQIAARANADQLEEGISPGSPLGAAANESKSGFSKTSEALSHDQFIVAGGCAIRPTPGGAAFGAQVPNSPWCPPPSSGDGWAALRSAEVRARIHVFSGGVVNLKISRDGSAVGFLSVPLNAWGNQRFFNSTHSEKTCKWIPTPPFRECTIRYGIPTPSLWRVELMNASGDGYYIGGIWFNQIDSRADTQPW